MKSTLTRLSVFISIIFGGLSLSQPANAAGEGEAILDKIVEWCNAKKTLEVDYSITAKGESMSGKMIMDGDRFRITSQAMDTWFDGTTQWTYTPSTKEVCVTEPTPEEIQQVNPFAIINAFRGAYNISMGQREGLDKRFDLLIMTPRRDDPDIKRVEVSVAKGAYHPSRIMLRLADGTVVALTLRRFIRGASYTAGEFTFDRSDYPGVKLVDLR